MTAKARTRAKPEADPAPKAGSKAAIDPVQRFPRREKRKQETRFRLTKAAGRLFEQQGYADTTMAEIAAAADVHVTTLFTHFKSKRELAEAVSDRTLENLAQFIADNQGKRPFFEAQRELVAQIADAFQRKAPYKLT
ncbi:MAG TPA: helix-turn-helix domain-containing protein, partial [Rhizomicrobium sp.]|nr:helix-turn-helix domain-containing protein [Rhizomicrobium sp.]